MKALKKTSENLKKVVDSITCVDFRFGRFIVSYYSNSSVTLTSLGRSRIGSSILSSIPTNWDYGISVSFDGGIPTLSLYIWL